MPGSARRANRLMSPRNYVAQTSATRHFDVVAWRGRLFKRAIGQPGLTVRSPECYDQREIGTSAQSVRRLAEGPWSSRGAPLSTGDARAVLPAGRPAP